MTTNILLAVDGTGSKEWRDPQGYNSHVRRFFLDFDGIEDVTKYYIDGPDTFGTDMQSIIDRGMTWIFGIIQRFINNKNVFDTFKINLIGHSRGGLAVIAIANGLNNLFKYESSRGFRNMSFKDYKLILGLPAIQINFIGLYDAVDRSYQVNIDPQLLNVVSIAHAKRLNPGIFRNSRPGFSGIETRGQLYFDTSHGGVGGDPGFFNSLIALQMSLMPSNPRIALWNDLYCNSLQLVTTDQEWNAIKPSIMSPFAWAWLGNEDKISRANKIRQYLTASRMADKFIRNEAQTAGVPFKGITPHIPWNTHDVNQARLGDKLFRILGMN